MADPLSSRLPSAYGLKIPLSWDLVIMLEDIIPPARPHRLSLLTMRVHLLFTKPRV